MIGQKILHYKILEKLGEGGMGIVYKAHDSKLERDVAIKFLPRHIAANAEERERFKIEAKAAAALNHPNIAIIHAIEEIDEDMFIVMEYIDGRELREIIQSEIPNLQSAIDYATQIVAGLQAAHEKDVTHRDIKSSNIMITDKGQVKIMDFGLAKIYGGPQLTKVGTTLGTTAYMSPEQARGEEVDERADIWSFGVVLYEILTGQQPFRGDYEQAVFYSIMNEEPTPLSEWVKDVPFPVETIVSRCLEKDPAKRYQTAPELLADVTDVVSDLGLVSRITTKKGDSVKRPRERSNRKLTFILTGLMMAVVVCLLLPGDWDVIKNRLGFKAVPDQKHLLVLPFTNVGGDQTRQAFCDGLVETLTSKVTQMEQFHGSLWVVPASEVRQNQISSPSEAQQSFGVNLCITGSLQIVSDKYRLTLNLVDAKNLRQMNSSVIDIGIGDVSALQDEAVIKMLEMLNLELQPEMRGVLTAGATIVPGAYEFYLQGRGYLQRYESEESLDAAVSLFKRAIEQDSLYALAHAGLGEAYWRKYEASKDPRWVDKAVKQCEQAIDLNSELAPVNVTLGIIHAGTGRYNDAIEDFKSALDGDPGNADAYRGLAKAYESKGILKEAELTYQKAIEMKPDYWAGYNHLGVFYSRHGRYEEAIEQFRQVVVLTPDNHRGYNNLGGMYYYLERWTEAREMYERAFAIKKSYSVSSNLGTLYYIEGLYGDAARMYETALELNDRDYLVWGNLASAYYWAPGERDKAQEIYQRAIGLAQERKKINPHDPDVISHLAGYYSMIGERNKAITLIEQALDMAPKNVQVMYRAGTTYEQLSDREKALHWISKALENGYSRSEIEHQPELRELLADARFQRLLKNSGEQFGKK